MPRFNPMDHPRLFRLIVNLWPPYLGAAISVEDIADNWQSIRVAMRLRWYNRNYVNSHFGGSLFSMTDPFYMLMLLRNLGREYVVWDLAARIQFLRPGRGKVSAHFVLDAVRLEDIRRKAESGEKVTEVFWVDIVDEQGERVAAVKKTLYIRKKSPGGATAQRVLDDLTSPPVEPISPLIVASGWGWMEVAGLERGKDWKLWPGGGRSWDWSEFGTGHRRGIQMGDIEELLERGSRVVVLTTGRLGRLVVPDAVVKEMEHRGIKVIVASTGKGEQIYNRYARQGIAVGGLFHSTC